MLSRLSVALLFVSFPGSILGQSPTLNAASPLESSSDASLVRMAGHVPTFARQAQDLGELAPDAQLTNVVVLLARTPEQEESLQRLVKDQQDPASVVYRQWLTPEAFGMRFGASDNDIAIVTGWLSSYGFKTTVSRSKSFIAVKGTTAQATSAFHTSFHTFNLDGDVLYSIIEEPSIPAEISHLVKLISGLSQVPENPGFRGAIEVKVSRAAHPNETTSNGNHLIAPADFATIFDINTVYSEGYNGSGRTIAIVGRSRVSNADIENFAAYTNLSLRDPSVIVPPGSVDPGETNNDDQGEATLDVERASSVAPGANIVLVLNASSNGGVGLPLQYVIDNRAADIITSSFLACEAKTAPTTVDFYSALFTQGAVEGITSFMISDDSGAAGCDPHSMPAPATQVLSINYYCASPNVTCVGGTELNDRANPSLYWSPTNSTGHESALGYIPEGAFNVPINASTNNLQVFASGGGFSTNIPKPSWQTGLNVPNDGQRDVPDIALPSSSHDGYLTCYAFAGFPCVPNAQGVTDVVGDSGTSAAAPSMAGIQALIDQAEGGPVGTINPRLYALAASVPTVFHDVTVASSGVTNCSVDVPSQCNNSTPSPTSLTGGLAGYLVGPGFDLVTGWGSLDVYNLLTNWSNAPSLAQPTINLVLPETIISTAQAISFSVSVSGNGPTPTGTIQYEVDGNPLQGPVTLSSGMATSPSYMSGLLQVHRVVAVYSGDTHYAPAISTTGQLTVTTPGAPIFTVTATPINISGPGDSGTSTVTVLPVNGFSGTVTFSCAGLGGFDAASCNFTPSSLNLNGAPGTTTLSLEAATPSLRRASGETRDSPGSRPNGLFFWGDGVVALLFCGAIRRGKRRQIYSVLSLAALGAVIAFDDGCSKASPTITITSAVNPATTQQPVAFTTTIASPGSAAAPTGSVQFLSNGVTIGSAQTLTNGVATLSQTFTTAGSFAITAQYFGSSSYATLLSAPLTETVGYKNPGAAPGNYTILVEATSGTLSQTVPVQVTVQ